jgi:hydroxyacylglutathione hydrolase
MPGDTIRIIPVLTDNYAYVVSDGETALVIDPGEPRPVREFIRQSGLKLEAVLLSHHHGDHTGGAGTLARAFGSRITSPDSRRVAGTDHMARPDSCFRVGTIEVQVLGLPGHTSTHVGFFLPRLNAVFTGDTLLGAGCGRLFEGTAAEMMGSLARLVALGDQTRVYFGHEYTEENLRFALTVEPDNPAVHARLKTVEELRTRGDPSTPSTIAEEKRTNPFLRVTEPSIKTALDLADADEERVFTELRSRKDRF